MKVINPFPEGIRSSIAMLTQLHAAILKVIIINAPEKYSS